MMQQEKYIRNQRKKAAELNRSIQNKKNRYLRKRAKRQHLTDAYNQGKQC
jgi:uncharacterized Zn-finger protein